MSDLNNKVGTFMHTVKCRQVSQKKNRDSTLRAIERKMLLVVKREINSKRFCLTCGVIIQRDAEKENEWCKLRRCYICAYNDKKAMDKKFCIHCGRISFKLEFVTGEQNWGTWVACNECKSSSHPEKNKEAKMIAKERAKGVKIRKCW